jgi:uncharacterized protein YaaN involved in tellurite resistance
MQLESVQAAQQPEPTVKELTSEEKQKVDAMMKDLDIEDSQSIIQFGVGAQGNISSFADTILDGIRSKDAGEAGDILSDLMLQVKSLEVDKLSSSDGFLSKIPILSAFVDNIKKFIARYEKVGTHIERIVDELVKARMQLLKDITMFDTLYEKNNEYLKELDLYILAGAAKLKELEEKIIPEIKAKAEASNDPMDAQKVQDISQMANRLEKKIHDLRLSRMVALQTNPQIRLIQNNDQLLVEKIQSSILNTIPLWKNQVIIAIGLFRQKKALEMQKEVSKTTNDLLKKNSEMLKNGSIEIAKESEKGIVEIETLKKVHADLVSTIEETLNIQQQGKVKRREAETELVKLENELKDKLRQVKTASPGTKLS